MDSVEEEDAAVRPQKLSEEEDTKEEKDEARHFQHPHPPDEVTAAVEGGLLAAPVDDFELQNLHNSLATFVFLFLGICTIV